MYLLRRNVCLDLLPTFVFFLVSSYMHFTLCVPTAWSISGTCVQGRLVVSATATCLQTLKDFAALPGPGDHLSMAFPVRTPSNPGLTHSGPSTLSASAHIAVHLPKLPASQKDVSYLSGA